MISYQMLDVDEDEAEYLLIAENVERRGQAETDPIKKSRIANFLREYWGVMSGRGGDRKSKNILSVDKSLDDISETLGESRKQTQRLMKLHDLIPQRASSERQRALVIRLFYEELAQEAKERQGERTDIVPDLEQSSNGRTNEILAKKAGIHHHNQAE